MSTASLMQVTDMRQLTPATQDYAYFQTSGFSPKPEPVIEEMVRWTRYINQAPALPEVYAWMSQAFEAT